MQLFSCRIRKFICKDTSCPRPFLSRAGNEPLTLLFSSTGTNMPTRAVARLHTQLVPQQENLSPSVLPSDIPSLCGYHVVTPCDGFFIWSPELVWRIIISTDVGCCEEKGQQGTAKQGHGHFFYLKTSAA